MKHYQFSIFLSLIIIVGCKSKSYRSLNYANNKLMATYNYDENGLLEFYTKYDSVASKIIEKEYYNNNELYTQIRKDTLGRCKYIYIRPLILDNRDTLFIHNSDSIPIKVFQEDIDCKISKFAMYIRDSKDKNRVLGIIAFNEIKYLYFDAPDILRKGNTYYITLYALDPDCKSFCDTIELGLYKKGKYIHIN